MYPTQLEEKKNSSQHIAPQFLGHLIENGRVMGSC